MSIAKDESDILDIYGDSLGLFGEANVAQGIDKFQCYYCSARF
jgi:hypothetical protein